MKKAPRIGIYAGSFDPVHAGHISFALQALQQAKLDEVIFLPERKPFFKPGAEHFGHRVAMLKTALKPHPSLSVAETVDRQFTVRRTLRQLRALLPPDAQLVFLFGADTVALLPTWPHAEELLRTCEIVVAVKQGQKLKTVQGVIKGWPTQPLATTIIPAHAPHVSSTAIRAALRKNIPTGGLLASVRRYAHRQWLYVSLDKLKNQA
ncbi:MAG: nicotinic acid mononucleotide adenylyltransferase [Candidatus Saccharibacteria bacterium]|nr:nicotinic acid mononucleotide adenylyltransferase [Candidatus Saccharibacteria bacterium]